MQVTSPATPAPPLLPPTLRTLLGLAAAAVVIAGIFFAKEIVGPIALAIVIVVICEPLRVPLERRGWPRWLSTTSVIALAYGILLAMGALLWFAGNQFVRLVIGLTDDGELGKRLDEFLAWLESLGITEQTTDSLAQALDPATLLRLASDVGGTVLAVATALFFVFAYVIFMAVDAARYRNVPGAFRAPHAAAIERITRLNSGIRRYFIVNAAFGAIVAIIDGLALWWMGVPGPAIWAVLAFVTNFIPNIGFVLGVIPPAILAFVVGDWPMLIGVIVVYSVVNVVLQVLVQPKFVSDAVDLSLTLSFFSVIFWTFVIGPLGAILSIPLTLATRALLLEPNPDALWLRWITGDRTAVPPGPPHEHVAAAEAESDAAPEDESRTDEDPVPDDRA
ncbi:AI-2E family transporter [Microbacterium keratanolyticum]|uniref:AI-2E family transporter n=1 Tax=Microbacterium keratanolyticum TaxID=67574 RepID=A0A9W6HRN8_9MICO|nr:AI-2E family transporter [Microbacterium keratanolyticum]